MKKSVKNSKRPDITDLIDKMFKQLVILEGKIDALGSLVSSSGRRPDVVQYAPERKQENGFNQRIMYKAVCADCSKACELPFRPSGDRPVYCKECFAKRKAGGGLLQAKKPEHGPSGRVVVYERRFQRDQAPAAPKPVEKKRHAARRKR